nr:importin subunit alpha-5 isoform X2 [Parasteatoda tepidariorum]
MLCNNDPSPICSQKCIDTEMSMEEIVRGICSQDAHQQFIAAQNARKILSRKSCPPIDAMIATGVVPYLVQFLICHDNIPLQFEACWAVANITSGNFVQRRTVVEAGAVPNFASLLSSPHANVAEKAVWALRKIAGKLILSTDGTIVGAAVCRVLIVKVIINMIFKKCSLHKDLYIFFTSLNASAYIISSFEFLFLTLHDYARYIPKNVLG